MLWMLPYHKRPDVMRAARERAAARRLYFQRIVRQARARPCVDCGTQLPPEVMHLDHVRGEKLFPFCHITSVRLAPGKTREEMMRDEIAKCEVRCPNCHAMRHYRERND